MGLVIDLAKRHIELTDSGRRLLFANDDSFFYLQVIALVGLGMKEQAKRQSHNVYVPVSKFEEPAWCVSAKKPRPFKSRESMRINIYQTWRRRLKTKGENCIYDVQWLENKSKDEQKSTVTHKLFDTESGKGPHTAAYKMEASPSSIKVIAENGRIVASFEMLERKYLESGKKKHGDISVVHESVGRCVGSSTSEPVERLLGNILTFKTFIGDRTYGFVGRDFVFDEIDRFLKKNQCGYFIICGDPGIGKSSIAAQLVESREYPHHFNIRTEGINKPDAFLKNVSSQLIMKYVLGYNVLPADATTDGRFLSKLLTEVSAKTTSEQKTVIVVDALDEVDQMGQARGANILYLPSTLPDGVYFILTRRPMIPADIPFFVHCPVRLFDLKDYENECLKDIQKYIRAAWKRPKLCGMGLIAEVK